MSYLGELCMDINEYAYNSTKYFHSNTTLYFMEGTHLLDSPLVVKSISNVSLVGVGGVIEGMYSLFGATMPYFEPLSRIQCATPATALSVKNVDGFLIRGISFINCGSTNISALYLDTIIDLSIYGIMIKNASGYGLHLLNADPEGFSATIFNSTFADIKGTALYCIDCITTVDKTLFFNTASGVVAETNGHVYLTQSTFVHCAQHCVISTMNSWVEMLRCSYAHSFICVEAELSEIYADDVTFFNSTMGLVAYSSYIKLQSCSFELVDFAMRLAKSGMSVMETSFINYTTAGILSSSDVFFQNCNFSFGGQTSIIAVQSTLYFHGNVSFANGFSTKYGGALYLSDSAHVVLWAPVLVSFINNSAKVRGGAVYVNNQDERSSCGFFLLHDPTGSLDDPMIQLHFEQNVANEAGEDVYASLNCTYAGDQTEIPYYDIKNRTNADIFKAIVTPSNISIAADPDYVCVNVFDGTPLRCSQNQTQPYEVVLFPGQSMPLLFSTLDEYNGSPPTVVFFIDSEGMYYDSWRTGNNYSYELGSQLLTNISLSIIPQHLYATATLNDIPTFRISVVVNHCPTGFSLNTSQYSCVCNNFLQSLKDVTCDIKTVTIHKPRNGWVGFTTSGAFGYYGQCPLDYCRDSHYVNSSDPDEQCSNNHSGELCGGCKPGLSHVFGQPLCQKCSNVYLLLLVPFAVMGIALVALIFALNLTVSNGVINGFIFYANIVKINDSVFQPLTNSNTFVKILSTFISWLNLDFGIVTCFFDGMDIYSKMALQFAFPAYLLLIVGLTILAGRHSRRVSWLLSKQNVVPVLATMVLMSYAKVFKTTIAILSFASVIVQADNTSTHQSLEIVWIHNGNIGYAEGGHGPLILVAAVIIVLFIVPYTILFLSTPVLQTKSELKVLSWVNKVKPFIDSYEGPYVPKHRFWTGVLLMARAVIYLMTASIQSTYPVADLIILITIMVGLLVYLARFGVYKKWQYTLLEMFLCANLATLCLFTLAFHSYEDNASSAAALLSLQLVYAILVGSVFIGFLLMLAVQTYSILVKLRPTKSKPLPDTTGVEPTGEYLMLDTYPKPTASNVQLFDRNGSKYDARYFREPLMDLNESI